MKIALVGTRGVPARYGGFETCVEEVGSRLSDLGHEVVVYCRSRLGVEAPSSYRGMQLVNLPAARRRAVETLSHSALSVAHLLRHKADVAFVFNSANAPLLPAFRIAGIPVATHVDGLEWRRGKWSGAGRRYYRIAEALAVRWSDALIADAQGIADYYSAEFEADTTLISYGAPIVRPGGEQLARLDLGLNAYHLLVARFEPENHVREIVEGYSASDRSLPLVVVGSTPYGDRYTTSVREAARGDVRFLGAVWDQELLDQLYANAANYLHGHSVGGTNPSLLRAMGAGAPCIAYDIVFNREVLGDAGLYFKDAADVSRLIAATEAGLSADRERRAELSYARALEYDWDSVAKAYESLASELSDGTMEITRPSGRRRANDGWWNNSD